MSAVDKITNFLATNRPPTSATLEDVREWVDGLGAATTYPSDVAPPENVGERLYRIAPHGKVGTDAILYLHGGGYVAGSLGSHGSMVATLASYAEMPVYFVDYRLAPEHTAPAALDDVIAAYKELAGKGLRVSVAGDSAGSGLAIALCLALRNDNAGLPVSIVCISPWTDLRREAGHHASTYIEPMLDSEALAASGQAYAGALALDDERISPGLADLSGLPPMLIQIGGLERLLADARTLAGQAVSAGVETYYCEWPGMIHVWHLFGDLVPEAAQALWQAAEQVRRWHMRKAG